MVLNGTSSGTVSIRSRLDEPGERLDHGHIELHLVVSIRSRLDEPGELFAAEGSDRTGLFQSAPGSMSRENVSMEHKAREIKTFQSAPGSMSRENGQRLKATIGRKPFQSAPGSMSRENSSGRGPTPSTACFNPLPAR